MNLHQNTLNFDWTHALCKLEEIDVKKCYPIYFGIPTLHDDYMVICILIFGFNNVFPFGPRPY